MLLQLAVVILLIFTLLFLWAVIRAYTAASLAFLGLWSSEDGTKSLTFASNGRGVYLASASPNSAAETRVTFKWQLRSNKLLTSTRWLLTGKLSVVVSADETVDDMTNLHLSVDAARGKMMWNSIALWRDSSAIKDDGTMTTTD